MSKIKSITCHKILNSRASWTIETHVTLEDGSVGIQSIPEGASKGEHEAISIPVERAVDVVSTVINDALAGEDATKQEAIDKTMISMDGTPHKRHLGANSILSVSLAIAHAAAKSKNLPLYEYLSLLYSGKKKELSKLVYPTPIFNILNGGKHANNGLSFQEFMVIPSRSLSYKRSLEMGVSIYNTLKEKLENGGFDVGVGDEGGFAPEGFTPDKALKYLRDAASENFHPGENVFFGMDIAAGSFYEHEKYVVPEEELRTDHLGMCDYYKKLLKKYELIYTEDPFYEKDYTGWGEYYKQNSERVMVVGDDLLVTNIHYLQHALDHQLCNAVIVKPNQIGTLTETFDFIRLAKKNGMAVIVSHRSGDTAEDTFIADLALAVEADFMKSGAPVRGERVAKYNRLLEVLAGD